ncbi:hematopoietic cell signal transducer [Megalops cyprinoides]|uniref:hematopoietic cell signal transducer n=1 Tax=Megalops cyprinoides TaxID=118141 RepID=UPI0018648194|nr:hematopoietic cell signal transducer [Megalops cyprinoides]
MAQNALCVFLFLCFYEMALAAESQDSGYCYKIEPSTMVGIVIGDVVLTVLIVITVYHCASRRRRQRDEADKVYMNVRANCKA